jgi:hypothetical protein
VPIEMKTSQSCAAANVVVHSSSGSISPNQTTPGLTYPSHLLHRGGSIRISVSGNGSRGRGDSCAVRQSMHLGECRLPCRWMTAGLPARSCRSSTFCVMTVSFGTCFASSTTA